MEKLRKSQPNNHLTGHALLPIHFKHINLTDNGQMRGEHTQTKRMGTCTVKLFTGVIYRFS